MFKRVLCALVLAALGSTAVSAAPAMPMAKHKMMAPKLSGKPIGAAEAAFVASIQADLMQRFPTAADAEKAGYVRFGNEDSTGAISYANFEWQSSDSKHPSQLWYDTKGALLGADFSVLKANSPNPPHLWGINPARWLDFKHPHYHYIVKDPKTGNLVYGGTGGKKYLAAGGIAEKPDPAVVVKLGKAAAVTDVVKFFEFPALWDLQVWVRPNPKGAFAEKNPNVIPSANAEKDSM
ncbi:MAG: hypothetical protein NVS9B12_14100 [Vulcanimicrobiaceae bacterium]